MPVELLLCRCGEQLEHVPFQEVHPFLKATQLGRAIFHGDRLVLSLHSAQPQEDTIGIHVVWQIRAPLHCGRCFGGILFAIQVCRFNCRPGGTVVVLSSPQGDVFFCSCRMELPRTHVPSKVHPIWAHREQCYKTTAQHRIGFCTVQRSEITEPREAFKRTTGNFSCGAVALWRCGAVALWRCGAVALWRCGAVALFTSVPPVHPAQRRCNFGTQTWICAQQVHQQQGIQPYDARTRSNLSRKSKTNVFSVFHDCKFS